ncbi:hypothetical protein RFI_25535 [Reticulomyxa filosa]|uniref:Uncharacterized protein n=1 Tax=Reticulomyxa filosa TaxID=46433 RepID=X6MDW5_RETFI|nr:hypothetical protein RFI_25535 [Reticulomyxa filosa]|eukprot:ETO11841.1 hypothetical protein RFI_25535 [Reticulomyxa filosa]
MDIDNYILIPKYDGSEIVNTYYDYLADRVNSSLFTTKKRSGKGHGQEQQEQQQEQSEKQQQDSEMMIPFQGYDERRAYMDKKQSDLLKNIHDSSPLNEMDTSTLPNTKQHSNAKDKDNGSNDAANGNGDQYPNEDNNQSNSNRNDPDDSENDDDGNDDSDDNNGDTLEEEALTQNEANEVFDGSNFDLQQYVKITEQKIKLVKKYFQSRKMVEALRIVIQVAILRGGVFPNKKKKKNFFGEEEEMMDTGRPFLYMYIYMYM